MSFFGPTENKLRKVSYICVSCRTQRSVIVDKDLHLDRDELKINGLASYIDIHDNGSPETEHGVKLYIDAHFIVRSNSVLMSPRKKINRTTSLPSLPSPVVSLHSIKLVYPSKSWNSLEISSNQHNIGYFVINTDPSISPEDKITEHLESSLGTVTATISFYREHLSLQELSNSKAWVEIMLEWIENTASLHAKMLPSIIRYIDKHTNSPPNVVDQLSIPILLDKSAKIQLKDNRQILQEIVSTTIQNPMNIGMFYPDKSVDYETLFLIKDKLSKRGFISMSSCVQGMLKEASNFDKALDAFVLFFFELVQQDSINYKVSHLL